MKRKNQYKKKFVEKRRKKILRIEEEKLIFSDGSIITFDHPQDCCEYNYADFQQLDDLARNYEFEGELSFEAIEGSGFRFGDSRRLFFVPCYSEQNGYYTDEIDIYFNGKRVLAFSAEFVDC